MRAAELVRVLALFGWRRVRQDGRHLILARDDFSWTVVMPNLDGDLRPRTIRGILRQVGLTHGEIEQLRRE